MYNTLFTRISRVPVRYKAFSTSQSALNARKSPLFQLRQKTGPANNLCREASDKHDNDSNQAEIWLQAQALAHSLQKATKVGSRSAKEGLFSSAVCQDNKSLTMFMFENQSFLENQSANINLISKRFKTKSSKPKNRGPKKQEEDEEEEDDDDGGEENPLLMDELTDQASDGSQRMALDVGSLRLDAVGKMAFAVTRLKMEEYFYKGDLYINGVRATKKGQDLHLGDEVDLIRQVNSEDRDKVDVRRFVIIKMPDKATEQGRMKITIDRWLDLTIDAPEDRVKGN